MTTRSISYSEINTVLRCEAQHSFQYTGALTGGDALKPKTTAPRLREGRAWGRAMAVWHEQGLRTDGIALAKTALDGSLEEDAVEQREAGVHDQETHDAMRTYLQGVLDHYVSEVDPVGISRPEHEIEVPLPSRTGRRSSNRYRFLAYLDGLEVDGEGREWIHEFKLRGSLSSFEQIVLSRQPRYYAWAAREALDINPLGVVVHERLNELPKPARILKNGKASHAKDQLTTPDSYTRACETTGEEPNPDTLLALSSRRWHQAQRIIFRPGELDEAGRELVSAAQLIHDLDMGHRFPIRNASRATCPSCSFKDICQIPELGLVDVLFDRTPPKRLRQPEEVAA